MINPKEKSFQDLITLREVDYGDSGDLEETLNSIQDILEFFYHIKHTYENVQNYFFSFTKAKFKISSTGKDFESVAKYNDIENKLATVSEKLMEFTSLYQKFEGKTEYLSSIIKAIMDGGFIEISFKEKYDYL